MEQRIPKEEWGNQPWSNWPYNYLQMTEEERYQWEKDNPIPEYVIKDRSWLDDYKPKKKPWWKI